MDGPEGLNWTVQMTESERSWVEMDGPKDSKSTVCEKSGRSERKTLDDLKQEK